MPTNEERREIANWLRDMVRFSDSGIFHATSVCSSLGMSDVDRYAPRGHYGSDDVMYLADLIEPEPERTCKFIHHECRHPNEKDACGKYQDCEWSCAKDSLYCSSCDKCVAVSFGRQLKVKKYSFCPYCGAKVVDE